MKGERGTKPGVGDGERGREGEREKERETESEGERRGSQRTCSAPGHRCQSHDPWPFPSLLSGMAGGKWYTDHSESTETKLDCTGNAAWSCGRGSSTTSPGLSASSQATLRSPLGDPRTAQRAQGA